MGVRNEVLRNTEDAAGRRLSVRDSSECFNCHATNAIKGGRVATDHMTAGVMCERCHGPSEKHVASFKSGDLKEAAMQKLGKLTTDCDGRAVQH